MKSGALSKPSLVLGAGAPNLSTFSTGTMVSGSWTSVSRKKILKTYFMLDSAEHDIYPAHKC